MDQSKWGGSDPFFNQEHATGAPNSAKLESIVTSRGAALKTRGLRIRLRAAPKQVGIKKFDISVLPRLPDTASEIQGIANALKVKFDDSVQIGKDVNEDLIKSQDLSKYRIIAFATHGLVPGDLVGLREPALALTAPKIAKSKGDGLLTMSEIMGLKLNADWVILSACNTGTARGAGAEAVSGLGRAFFYAGTKSLLVSNWPVETVSARLLTTDLFERQTKDATLTRAEALRQSMAAMLDRPGQVNEQTKKPFFYYAHPIFWAPFMIVGDGGRS